MGCCSLGFKALLPACFLPPLLQPPPPRAYYAEQLERLLDAVRAEAGRPEMPVVLTRLHMINGETLLLSQPK